MLSKLKKANLIKDILSLLVVTFVSKGTIFFINLISAKFLTSTEFGLLSILRSTAGMLESLFSGINGSIIINEISKDRKVTQDLIYLFIFYIVIISVILFFIPILSIPINIFVLTILTFSIVLNTIVNLILIGLSYYSEQKRLTLVSCISSAIVSIIIIRFYGLQGAAAAFILLPLVDFVIKSVFLFRKKFISSSKKGTKKLVRKSFKYIAIVTPQIILFWWLRVSLGSNAIKELGLFEFLYQFITLIILMTGAVASVSIGKFGKLDQYNILRQASLINLTICIVLISCCFFFGNDLILLINSEYDISNRKLLFFTMLLMVFPLSFTSLLSNFFLANGKDAYNILASMFAIVATVFLILASQNSHILTIVYSYLIYYSVNFSLLLFLLFRFVKNNE